VDKQLNTLPLQTYVRSRVGTIVVDVGDDSSGTVPISLAKPSDVTLIVASSAYVGMPEIFVAAIDRTPTLSDFDVIIAPTDNTFVKVQDRVTLHLLAGEYELRWKGSGAGGTPQAFPTDCSRIVLAIDQ